MKGAASHAAFVGELQAAQAGLLARKDPQQADAAFRLLARAVRHLEKNGGQPRRRWWPRPRPCC